MRQPSEERCIPGVLSEKVLTSVMNWCVELLRLSKDNKEIPARILVRQLSDLSEVALCLSLSPLSEETKELLEEMYGTGVTPLILAGMLSTEAVRIAISSALGGPSEPAPLFTSEELKRMDS